MIQTLFCFLSCVSCIVYDSQIMFFPLPETILNDLSRSAKTKTVRPTKELKAIKKNEQQTNKLFVPLESPETTENKQTVNTPIKPLNTEKSLIVSQNNSVSQKGNSSKLSEFPAVIEDIIVEDKYIDEQQSNIDETRQNINLVKLSPEVPFESVDVQKTPESAEVNVVEDIETGLLSNPTEKSQKMDVFEVNPVETIGNPEETLETDKNNNISQVNSNQGFATTIVKNNKIKDTDEHRSKIYENRQNKDDIELSTTYKEPLESVNTSKDASIQKSPEPPAVHIVKYVKTDNQVIGGHRLEEKGKNVDVLKMSNEETLENDNTSQKGYNVNFLEQFKDSEVEEISCERSKETQNLNEYNLPRPRKNNRPPPSRFRALERLNSKRPNTENI